MALDDQHPEQAALEAACILSANFTRVVQDITNPGPKGISSKAVSQTNLKRLPSDTQPQVRSMLTAVTARLLGQEAQSRPASKAEALVWMSAARFVSSRLQCSAGDCKGRKPDMTPAQGEQMRHALGKIEAACKLMSNMETVVKDITNNRGTAGVYESEKSHPELARLDPTLVKPVEDMLNEVCNRLFGSVAREASAAQMKTWAAAAGFFGQRIQDPERDLQECNFRSPDMSLHAAQQLRAVLARMEAAYLLTCNMPNVSADITNPAPKTQLDLKRVSAQGKPAVDNMLKAVVTNLQGKGVSAPSPSEAAVWAEAAVYLSGRIQSTTDDCPGRKQDMSLIAGLMMSKTLGAIEAACKLASNREKVVNDITNPAPKTQQTLRRVERTFQASVNKMVDEVSARLLGNKVSEPGSASEAQVWQDAAAYLHGRIQSSAGECQGREPDMTPAAASAMRAVLRQISSKSETIEPANKEAAVKLMGNRDRVVKDICNTGRSNIEGKALTQPELRRLDKQCEETVHAMISDVCCSLTHKSNPTPATAKEPTVWRQAATYLSGRVQGSSQQMPGRNPDMSGEAADALKDVLAHF